MRMHTLVLDLDCMLSSLLCACLSVQFAPYPTVTTVILTQPVLVHNVHSGTFCATRPPVSQVSGLVQTC